MDNHNMLRFITRNHPQRADTTQNLLQHRSIVLIIHFLILSTASQARIRKKQRLTEEGPCQFFFFCQKLKRYQEDHKIVVNPTMCNMSESLPIGKFSHFTAKKEDVET